MLIPAIGLLAVFVAYPFSYGVWISLTDAYVGEPGRFVGLQNFFLLMKDETYRKTLFNTFEYTFVSTALKFAFGLLLAVVLNQSFRLRRFVRAVVLLPWIIPTVLSTLAWVWLFDSSFGAINWTLKQFGVTGPIWLGEGHWPMISLIITSTWRGAPFFGICFLAGMQTIDPQIYEAARADGASAWRGFWHITFPLLRPVATVVTLLSLILSFGDFQLIYTLTKGGPANNTQVLATLSYFVGIQGGQLGIGAAIALTLFPLLGIVIMLTLRSLTRR
jgi:multiple sugar transport system permease protein